MPGWPGISIDVHERTNRLNFFDFQLFGLFFCLKIFNLFLWTFSATYIFPVMFGTFLFFIPKKNKFWFGRNPSVCTHKKTEIGPFFKIFVIFCLQLLWLFYFFKYLNHFLWTFKKNFLFSDKFRAFLFLQLRKILPSWPGIRTNVHERTDIFGNFVYIFWKARLGLQLKIFISWTGDHPLVWAEK